MDFIEQTANSVGRERPHWNISPEKISRFLSELTDLSHRHGVAIGDEPHAFLIEREDRESSYTLDDESRLRFG